MKKKIEELLRAYRETGNERFLRRALELMKGQHITERGHTMKTNFRIMRGADYQSDKCYRVSYEEHRTLYTIPEPHYTKAAAEAEMKRLKKIDADCNS